MGFTFGPYPPFIAGALDGFSSSVIQTSGEVVVPEGGGVTYYCPYATGYVYTDANGGRHGLGVILTAPQAYDCTTLGMSSVSVSSDDTYLFNSNDNTGGNYPALGNYYIADAHGNTVSNVKPASGLMEDSNGNQRNSTGRPWSSTVNSAGNPKTLTLPWSSTPYTYTYTQGPVNVKYAATMQSNSTQYCDNFGSGSLSTTIPQLSSISMPNGQQYHFSYDPGTGYINQITYPTGAYVSYTWGVNYASEMAEYLSNITAGFSAGEGPVTDCYYVEDWNAVQKRVVSYDGVHPAQQQVFSYTTGWDTQGEQWDYKTTTVITTDLLTTLPGGQHPVSKTVYTYSPSQGMPAPLSTAGTPVLAVENTIQYYAAGAGAPGPLMHTTVKSWNSPNQLSYQCERYDDAGGTPPSSGSFYTYETPPNMPSAVSDIKEYGSVTITTVANDTGSTPDPRLVCSASGTPLKETTNVYQVFPPSKWPTTFPNVNSMPYYMVDRPCATGVNYMGSQVSETIYSYDQTALAPVSAPVGHDETNYAYNTGVARGNVTTIRKVSSPSNIAGVTQCSNVPPSTSPNDSVTTISYDATGQPVGVTDPNNNTTKLFYADHYTTDDGSPPGNTNAYVTSIQNAINQTQNFQWDYYKGELRVAEDVNSNYSYYQYNDVWLRPTQSQFPGGGLVNKSYNDVGPNPTNTTTTAIDATHTESSTNIMDARGHVVETQLTSDVSGTIYADTSYDGFGRVSFKSLPYRASAPCVPSTSPPVNLCHTAYTYDPMNRTLSQTNADGGVKTWSYAGLTTTVTDEVGNQWQNTSDVLKRLTTVLEPNGTSSAPSMETDYAYDGLDDLTGVTQYGGARGTSPNMTRTFQYDAFARLISALNPESGSTTYKYDPNNNLMSKTDANNVTTTYCPYDQLNRPTCKTYSDGYTPSIYYTYDSSSAITNATNTVGRMTNETTQKGSIVLTKRSYSYDPMGRVAGLLECVATNCASPYLLSYTYNDAGDLQTSTNGVATQPITLTYNYDAANRLATITSSWFDNATHPQVLFSAGNPLTSAAAYSPFGLQVAQLGVDGQGQGDVVAMVRGYDVRGRLATEIDLGDKIASMNSGHSTGRIVITGTEETKNATSATPATTTITITGYDGSTVTCNGSVPPVCTTVFDSGTVQVMINGVTYTASYTPVGSPATQSSVATSLAAALNSGNLVTATASGSTISVTTKATGTAANYEVGPLGSGDFAANFPTTYAYMTGGTNASPAGSDTGTITATINGQSATATWQAGSTTSSLASALASAINSADSSFVQAASSGGTVTVTSVGSGADVNYDIGISTSDTAGFSAPSFTAPASQMSGGDTYATSPTVYSYTGPGSNGTMTFALNGNVTNVTDSVMGAWTYSYDTLNRVMGAAGAATGTPSYAGVSLGWTYDNFGNRLTESVTGTSTNPLPTAQWTTYNPGGTLTNRVSGATQSPGGFTYDADGNVLDDGNINYLYDANGHICAGDLVPHPTSRLQYIYDAEGNRVAKGSITSLSCDATTNGFVLTNSYVVGLNGEEVSELNGSFQWQYSDVYAGGKLLATQNATDTIFALNDWLGTKRAVAGASGCAATFVSFPFGDALTQESLSGIAACFDPSDQHFTGKQRDSESGLDFFGARYYTSVMGRWQSPDWSAQEEPVPYAKMDDPQTLNLYSYVHNNPVSGFDPDGHDWIDRWYMENSAAVDNATFQATNPEQQEGKMENDFLTEERNRSSGGSDFWSRVGQRLHNFFGGRGFVTNTELDNIHGAFSRYYIVPGSVQEVDESNPYLNFGMDAAGIGASLSGHPVVAGEIGIGSSIYNPDPMNVGLNGMSMVEGTVGEAGMGLTVAADEGRLAGGVITNNIMAPMLEAIPGDKMSDGNGHMIATPDSIEVKAGICQ